ncbi:MAG TPA: alpha-glucosidase [Stellaceae bacterium]|nr:alpha-glucosidase [Stellaceae bacterium]
MPDAWRQGAVIYHVYPRSFRDSNGDGVGDLAGITEKLDYVASLGVDGLWISPFFASPMRDFGYDVSDYRAVDPIFGTVEDFDRLLARAHGLGLKVILDMVWSHTSDQHSWFAESRLDRHGAKADWYVWAEPRPDGGPPNNWLSVFGGSAWTWEPRRRQYYLHHFLPAQPKLNLRNDVVVAELLEAGAFWLNRGVDGFRMDAVDFMAHDALLRDNPAASVNETPLRPFAMQVHRHDLGDPATFDVLARTRALLDRYPGSISIAEVGSVGSADNALERAAGYVGGEGRRLHAAYTLHVAKGPGELAAIRNAIAQAEQSFDQGSIVWSFSNHDIERVATRWGDGGPGSAKVFLALLATMRGCLTLYQGEELGLPEPEIAQADVRDPYGRAYWPLYKGRDGSRTPMPWEHAAVHAGFCDGAEPWLPVAATHLPLAVDRQDRDPHSVLTAWRALSRLRRDNAVFRLGSLQLLDAAPPLLAFERRHGRDRALCLFNLGDMDGRFAIPQRTLPLIIGGCRMLPDADELVLPPKSYFVATLPGVVAPV